MNLKVEVFSEGACFQEHHIVDKDAIVLEEDAECEEYCIEDMDTKELCDCIKEINLSGRKFLKHLDG